MGGISEPPFRARGYEPASPQTAAGRTAAQQFRGEPLLVAASVAIFFQEADPKRTSEGGETAGNRSVFPDTGKSNEGNA